MTDPITPTPAPAPKKRKSPGPLNSALLDHLQTDEDTINAALDEVTTDPALASALAPHFLDRDNTIAITPASLTTLSAQVAAARATGADVLSGRATFHSVTDDEGTDQATAVAAIRNVQTRAKEKYEETDPSRLYAYLIGQPLKSRSQITQAATALYTLLRTTDDNDQPVTPKDTLPGFGAAQIAQFKTDLGSYGGVQTRQSGAQSDATGSLQDFEDECAQVTRRRRKLQLAVDAERPFTDPANAPLRTRLGLPADKGMS
jgi:hypothetical protein